DQCMNFALPPMKVSSASTAPFIFAQVRVCIASQMRWSMNQPVFWVTPSARANSYELIPFLLLASIHSAGSHLSKPMGLSSKIVPSFTENCRPHSRHFQMRRVLRKPWSLPSQAGQVTPFGQRRDARKVSAVSLSAKYRIASVSELGKRLVLAMQKGTSGGLVCQVCY